MGQIGPRTTVAVVTVVAMFCASHAAVALDTLRVAKAGESLIFTSLDVGTAAKIWESVGLTIESIQMVGEAPMDKAFISGDIDMALGGGNSMGFRLKGVPNIAVAAMSGPPYDFVLSVAPNSPYKTVADLKGKPIGVTSAGSITDFLVHELSRLQGWGTDGMTALSLGATRTRLAALKNGEIAAMITTPEGGYDSEENGGSRVLLLFGEHIKDFLAHTILARQSLVDEHPEIVARFLKGWFKTVAYMKNPANRAQAVKIVAERMQISETAAGKAFDVDMKGMSLDGAFLTSEVEAIRQSLPVFGILDHVPAAKDLYTDRFVPVKLDD
ncbi:MAG: nitrate/sulfonate/bicarbonate transporter substrate-binding protein [Rhodospirillales bacterium]|jgi:NitT/TauT family transport system substrate-binding protein|nr:nitrate/sulfonate/bicarbonate transporter substrate-binding protein [Rhodospirillales bacterium]